MKLLKHITTILLFFIAISVTAQQGINYKAIIKDDFGNVIAGTDVVVLFTIYEGDELIEDVYVEQHAYTTDENGLIILNIGTGNTVDYFNAINWGADEHFLNVQVNVEGGGLTDLGTTQFMTVPYAKYAANTITKLNELTDAKSDDDGTNNGSSIFLGVDSGLADDGTNNRNVGVGFETLKANTFGYNNVANGHSALKANTEGHSNIAIGANVLTANTIGIKNTAIGSSALAANTEGYDNSASGIDALRQNTTGNFNVANGSSALQNNTTGSSNIALGTSAGIQNVSGNNNVFIGNGTGSFTDQSDKLYIDNSSTSTPLIYGDFDSNFVSINGSLNIDTSSPNPLALTSSSADNYLTFNTSSGYKGYSGIYNGDNDMDFGTGVGNASGKVHLVTNTSPKLTVTSNGNVGIGTENPTQALDVVGKIKVTNDSATPTAGTIRFNESENAFEGFIEGTGWITLGAKKKEKTIVIPSSQFVALATITSQANNMSYGSSGARPQNTTVAFAPIVLPVDSKLLNITCVFIDSSFDSDLFFSLIKYCGDSTAGETSTTIWGYGMTNFNSATLSKFSFAIDEIVAPTCQYQIKVQSYPDTWSGLGISKIYLTYEED